MPCYLYHARLHFLLLLLLIFTCVICGDVKAASGDLAVLSYSAEGKSVDLFKPGNIVNVLRHDESTIGSGSETINVKNVKTPFLFAAEDMMFAFAVVNYNENAETKNKLIAKYIETNKNNWGENAVKSALNEWKTQLVTNNYDNDENINFAFAVEETAEMATNGEKNIYLFAVDTLSSQNVLDIISTSSPERNLNFIVGTFTDKPSSNKVTWESKNAFFMDVTSKIYEQWENKSQQMDLSGGAAFVTKNGNITVLLMFTIKGDEHKNVIAVNRLINSRNGEEGKELNSLHVEIIEDSVPYFFQWNDKIMMVLTDQKNNGAKQTVKEFNFTKEEWEESKESIARLSHFLNDKGDFTTARIGKNNKSVLLFTQHKTKNGDDEKNKKDVHLWVTDGDHLSDVGTVAANIDGGGDYYYYGSILHTNNELFILQQKYSGDGKGVDDTFELTRLKEQLKKMTDSLEIWKKADELVSKVCGDKNDVLSKKLCAAQLSTDGLVGFLRDTSTNNSEWVDEYYYTNATVTNGKKVPNGFLFDGRGAGVKWPVGKNKEDQPYNFTDPGFTLVATVKIGHNGDKKDNSLLGVSFGDDGKKGGVGLWCTNDDKWGVSGVDGTQKVSSTTGKECTQGGEYHVALVLRDEKLLVYVDWEKLTGITKEIKKPDNINYFYFGAGGPHQNEVESHVTVTNVLLYNRPFSDSEMEQLQVAKKKEVEQTNEDFIEQKKDDGATTKGNGNDGKSPSESSRTGGEEDNTTTSLPSAESTVRVGVLSLLTLLFLCARVLLLL